MKRNLLTIPCLILFLAFLLFACQKKDELGITKPGFKEEMGTGGNPIKGPEIPTPPTSTNPPTKNTGLTVGGIGWNNPGCDATAPFVLRGTYGNTEVTLTFLNAPSSGTFVIKNAPSNQACTMTVYNAPDQPAGVIWHGKSGVVVVNNTNTNNSVNATFNDIVCVQETFNFPAVTVSGVLGCN